MTTVFDAPMHDFPGDNIMDADMLPPSTSDADWLQVENMMEDGDASRPLAEEVDMTHGDVQEFEMRDAGETDYIEDQDQMLPEVAGPHIRAEPQDHDILDASRAPSPTTQLAFSHPGLHSTSMRSKESLQEPHTDQESSQEATQSVSPDLTISQRDKGMAESSIHPVESSEEPISVPLVEVEGTTINPHNTPASSGNSHGSTHSQTQAPSLEPPEHGGASEPFPDRELAASAEPSQEGGSLSEGEESSGSGAEPVLQPEVDGHSGAESVLQPQVDGHSGAEPVLQPQMDGHSGAEPVLQPQVDGRSDAEPLPQSDEHVENQVTQEEEEGPLIDPPPAVLLSYPFDGSHLSLFNLPEESQHGPVVTGTGDPSIDHDEAAHEPDDKHITSRAESLIVSEAPILLFRGRFALYYEPLSRVFEALRGDETINTEGRFDHNIELVISAPELDLTLPEDNFNAREVSLHDLGVLHTGCDLSGPLSLRLDTISPRFGTRYRAIRDEIVRVVSQQEEDERRSELESTEPLYTNGALLHSKQDQHEALGDHSSIHHPAIVEHNDEDHEQSSESRAYVRDNDTHEQEPDVHHVETEENAQDEEDAEGDADAEGYEDAESGEYIEYEQYDDSRDDAAEEIYEGAEGEYAGEERGGEEVEYEHAEAPYSAECGEEQQADDQDETQTFPDEAEQSRSLFPDDANESEVTGEALDDLHELIVQSGDQKPSAADPSDELESTSSTTFVPVEELTDSYASTSAVLAEHFTNTPELDHSVHEVTSHDFFLSAEPFSDTEPLLSEARPLSRSDTSHLPTSVKIGHDEVIAYEDTVGDVDDEVDEEGSKQPQPTLPVNSGIQDSRAISTASKRSYDEREFDQLEGVDAPRSAPSEAKRLRAA